MTQLPDTCPICGASPMYMQILHNEDTVYTVGSGCVACQEVWVLSTHGLEDHPNRDDILLWRNPCEDTDEPTGPR